MCVDHKLLASLEMRRTSLLIIISGSKVRQIANLSTKPCSRLFLRKVKLPDKYLLRPGP